VVEIGSAIEAEVGGAACEDVVHFGGGDGGVGVGGSFVVRMMGGLGVWVGGGVGC